MNNLYFEQNLISRDFETRQRKNKTNNIVSTAIFAIGIVIIMSCVFTIGLDNGWIIIIALIAASLPFFAISILMNRYAKKRSTEYDYTITDTTITISAVYFRSQRKLLYKIESTQILSVGKFGSQACLRAEKSVEDKRLAVVNYDDENSIAYILYNRPKDGKKVLLFIEPSKEFMINLRRAVSRYEVFDDSVKEINYFTVEDDEKASDNDESDESASSENSEDTLDNEKSIGEKDEQDIAEEESIATSKENDNTENS